MSKRKSEGETKSAPVSIKVTQEFRDRLDAAAVASGRSLAQEVEMRLEQSLRDSPPGHAPWSDVTWNFSRIVGLTLAQIDSMAGRRWIETKQGCEAARNTVAAIFNPIRPALADEAPMTPQEQEEAERLSAFGRASADYLTMRTDLAQYRAALPCQCQQADIGSEARHPLKRRGSTPPPAPAPAARAPSPNAAVTFRASGPPHAAGLPALAVFICRAIMLRIVSADRFGLKRFFSLASRPDISLMKDSTASGLCAHCSRSEASATLATSSLSGMPSSACMSRWLRWLCRWLLSLRRYFSASPGPYSISTALLSAAVLLIIPKTQQAAKALFPAMLTRIRVASPGFPLYL